MEKEYRPITIPARGKCRCHARVYTWPTGICTNLFFDLSLIKTVSQIFSSRSKQYNFEWFVELA